MGRASTEAKRRWNDKTYRRFNLFLRKEEDKDYIEYLTKRKNEGESLADIIKEGLDAIMDKQNYKTL